MRHSKADAAAQQAFREKIEQYEKAGRPIVYIDESGFAHDMPRAGSGVSVAVIGMQRAASV